MDADVSGCSARVPFLREFLCAWGGDRLADSGAHAGQVLGRHHPEVSRGVRGKLVRETEGGFHLRSRLLKGLFSISWEERHPLGVWVGALGGRRACQAEGTAIWRL